MTFEFGETKVFVKKEYVGVWKITKEIWEIHTKIWKTKWTPYTREKYRKKIKERFCIDWDEVSFAEMDIPMLSAITIAIILEVTKSYFRFFNVSFHHKNIKKSGNKALILISEERSQKSNNQIVNPIL